MYINSILAVICNTKQEERLCILLLFISRLPGLLPFYFLLLIPHFHRIWYRVLFLPRLLLLSQFLHSLRCPPCFQWVTWHSRPQYCTVWHNLKGCNGRNGVLGLPQVEQLVSRMLLPTVLYNYCSEILVYSFPNFNFASLPF